MHLLLSRLSEEEEELTLTTSLKCSLHSPGKVRELKSGQGKVRENGTSQWEP